MCVLITVKIHCLLECKYGHFCPMCLLETKLAVSSPQVSGESRQQDLLKYHGECCGNCNWPVIVISVGSLTPCIRVLGSLPVSIQPERNIGQQSLRCKLINFRCNSIIANSLIFQSCHNSRQLMNINNIIMAWFSPQCINDLIVEPTEFAFALLWSLNRCAILLSPEVIPNVSGRDSYLGLSAIISFQKSLHTPFWSFDSIDWERSWSPFSLKNFISCQKTAHAIHCSSATGPLLGRPAIFQWLTASLYRAFNPFARPFHPGTLNFEGFRIPNISLPLLSIVFEINVNKSSSLFVSVPQVPHVAFYATSDYRT